MKWFCRYRNHQGERKCLWYLQRLQTQCARIGQFSTSVIEKYFLLVRKGQSIEGIKVFSEISEPNSLLFTEGMKSYVVTNSRTSNSSYKRRNSCHLGIEQLLNDSQTDLGRCDIHDTYIVFVYFSKGEYFVYKISLPCGICLICSLYTQYSPLLFFFRLCFPSFLFLLLTSLLPETFH